MAERADPVSAPSRAANAGSVCTVQATRCFGACLAHTSAAIDSVLSCVSLYPNLPIVRNSEPAETFLLTLSTQNAPLPDKGYCAKSGCVHFWILLTLTIQNSGSGYWPLPEVRHAPVWTMWLRPERAAPSGTRDDPDRLGNNERLGYGDIYCVLSWWYCKLGVLKVSLVRQNLAGIALIWHESGLWWKIQILPRSRDSSLVRAPDSLSKGCEFESRQERRESFLLQSQLCVLTLIRCPVYLRVTAVARKRHWSFRQKCRWQVTSKDEHTRDPDVVREPIRKRAHTQLVREHSAIVVSARRATVDWSWHKEWNWCARANLHFKKKKKKCRRGMNGRPFSQNPHKRGKSHHVSYLQEREFCSTKAGKPLLQHPNVYVTGPWAPKCRRLVCS